jgi:hypothetical protein
MDDTLSERLTATVKVSYDWSEQLMDALGRLGDEIELVPHAWKAARPEADRASPCAAQHDHDDDQAENAMEARLDLLRGRLRDALFLMQYQDVIGQDIGRVITALDRRRAAIQAMVDRQGSTGDALGLGIGELLSAYRAEDDLHRRADSDE